MSIQTIDPMVRNFERISDKLEQISFNSIRNILPDKVIIEACKAVGHKYRERKITPIVTVLHMILAAIWPEDSFNASWQIMWAALVSRFSQFGGKSPSRGKVSQARARLPLELWHFLFKWICQKAQELSCNFDKWKGHRVVLLDGTCVSMSNNPDLLKEFGSPTGSEHKCRYPLARMVTLCTANTMTVLDYALGRYDQDENALARPILKNLQKGDLLLADRHFAAAHFYRHYMAMGLEFLTRAHHRLKISRIQRITSYSKNDFIGWMIINENYRKKDGTLPTKIAVRFIRATVCARGRSRTFWFVTSLLDAERYPAREIAELYCRRWRIETLFREVKINLSADVLRSLSPDGIRKEVVARLIAVNIVRIIMLESAINNNVDPMRISFTHAVRAIVIFAPALATEPIWKLPKIYETMLEEIACHLVPCRHSRNEPRCVTRERKHYPKLKTTRNQWREVYAA
jgi:hypothetical protein